MTTVDKKELTHHLRDLTRRIEALEQHLGGEKDDEYSQDEAPHYCALPQVPERTYEMVRSADRLELLILSDKKWVNGTVLHYYFFTNSVWGGGEDQKDVVRRAFQVWKDVGIGIEFREVTVQAEAEIRIGFQRGDGAWSYVGRDALNIGQSQRTMNFGWDLTRQGEIDTAIHEIGHALGFPHEHQNPNAGIVWDEDKVYADLAGAPNRWSRDKTYWNILRKLPATDVDGSDWDPDSVMHYPFGPGLIKEPAKYRNGLNPQPGLSQKDIEQVRRFYPAQGSNFPELKPFESQRLSIAAAEQKDFAVLPKVTRNYTFSTFGESDTVMVLFEERDGELRYVKGDDDSGLDTNAKFTLRLVRDRKYVLRIRLYYAAITGDTAVMMW